MYAFLYWSSRRILLSLPLLLIFLSSSFISSTSTLSSVSLVIVISLSYGFLSVSLPHGLSHFLMSSPSLIPYTTTPYPSRFSLSSASLSLFFISKFHLPRIPIFYLSRSLDLPRNSLSLSSIPLPTNSLPLPIARPSSALQIFLADPSSLSLSVSSDSSSVFSLFYSESLIELISLWFCNSSSLFSFCNLASLS